MEPNEGPEEFARGSTRTLVLRLLLRLLPNRMKMLVKLVSVLGVVVLAEVAVLPEVPLLLSLPNRLCPAGSVATIWDRLAERLKASATEVACDIADPEDNASACLINTAMGIVVMSPADVELTLSALRLKKGSTSQTSAPG